MTINQIEHWMREIEGLPEFTSNRNSDEKLRWLNLHLHEYLERWAGLTSVPGMNVKVTLANDTFYLTLAATNLTNKLLKGEGFSITFPTFEWERFQNALEFIQDHPCQENVGFVLDEFKNYYAALSC